MNEQSNSTAEATFGAGCFWCVEAVFDRLNGVKQVVSGYSGGHVKNPAYREVCNGTTGHAEVARIVYDPSVISYAQLLEVFFATHDPTTLNRQGGDVGTQYRSVIFYQSEAERDQAQKALQALRESGSYGAPIVTAVEPLRNFYPAEDYHQQYFAHNSEAPYCAAVIRPKLDKFEKRFRELLREGVSA